MGGKEARQERKISNGCVESSRVLFIKQKWCERARGGGRSKLIREETKTELRWTEVVMMECYCVYMDLSIPVMTKVSCFLVCAHKHHILLPERQQSLCFSVLMWYSSEDQHWDRVHNRDTWSQSTCIYLFILSMIKEKEKGESEKCRLGCGEEGKYQEEGKK